MEYDMPDNAIIEFKNISKNFGAVKALQAVSFSIRQGECHAIVGENGAGKSTLMNILSGLFLQDSGEVIYKSKPVLIDSPSVANELGISTVYQELKLCPNLTAAENIFLGRVPTNWMGVINRFDMDREADKLLDMFGIEIDIHIPVKKLSIAQMQLVEVAKAISWNSEVLILDEPTSSLTATEADILFGILHKLKADGKTLIFISHRLTEIFQVADSLSVMRDGCYIGTYACNDLTEEKVVELITGKKIVRNSLNEIQDNGGKVALEVKNLNMGNRVKDISFVLYEGEILGLYGLQGAGRTELVETIFGLHHCDNGSITVYGKPIIIKKPSQAIKAGIGLITEDRKNSGIFAKMNVSENITIIHNRLITFFKFILAKKKIAAITRRYREDLSIKMDTDNESILKLSGGNQQKVIIARMLSQSPSIILADEPTRGVDVGAKAEIFSIFQRLKHDKKAILVISSELKEIVNECDRILVMRNGRIAGEVRDKTDREGTVLHYSFI
jgi:ABC-type sugar transport system ATPase subunit